MTITPFYAALLVLLYLWLTAQVILYRRANFVSLGDQGDKKLAQLIRAHGNFTENAPMGIVLVALVELQGAMPGVVIHALGLLLLVGRCVHGYAFSHFPLNMRGRVAGMALTLTMLALSALTLLAGLLV